MKTLNLGLQVPRVSAAGQAGRRCGSSTPLPGDQALAAGLCNSVACCSSRQAFLAISFLLAVGLACGSLQLVLGVWVSVMRVWNLHQIMQESASGS